MAGVKNRPSDRPRLAAVRILHAVLEEGAYANVRSVSLLERAGLDARGRRFASALIYGTLSRIHSIDYILLKASHRQPERLESWTRTVLRLAVWQLYWGRSVPARSAVDEAVRLTCELANPGAAGYVNAVLRRLATAPVSLPENNLPVLFSLSPELFGYLRKWYGQDEARLLAQSFLREEIEVTARVNCLKGTAEELQAGLAADGMTVRAGLYCPEALRLELGGSPVRGLPSFQDGRLTIQDEAAMLVGHAAAPGPGQRIIDLCAAPGGKTTHLAELSGDKADILAFDSHPRRLRLVEENAGRLGLTGITCRTGDATGKDMDPQLRESADLVLADVPCSGLGLLARKPEIRLSMTHEKIIGLYPLQEAILDYAATLVRSGGVLVYSTCTINPAENIERVRAFLTNTGGRFRPESLEKYLPAAVLRQPDLAASASQGYLQLLPHRHELDGFFLFRMRRI